MQGRAHVDRRRRIPEEVRHEHEPAKCVRQVRLVKVQGQTKDEKDEDDDKNEKSSGAAKACKAERASMGVEAFAKKYGTNHNLKNAFGKCVSGKSKSKDKDND